MPTSKWTSDQQKVIDSRKKNVLVSAAAGSGKTTVLIERIFSKISDRENPVDVDKFVIVTFTRAAAAQMKEKLRSRIENEIERQKGDSHLQRQLSLLSHAHISTIHSFCGFIIQNYFHRINLDPSYRQASDSELAIIKAEVLEDILEREYEKGADDFVELASMNKFNKSDADIENMIYLIYEKAMSEPFPDEWFEKMENFFSVKNEKEWENSEIVQYMLSYTKNFVREIGKECKGLIDICNQPDGPYCYLDNIVEIQEISNEICQKKNYGDLYSYLKQLKFKRLNSSRDKSVNVDKKDFVKEKRTKYKEEIVNLQKKFFYQSAKEHLEDLWDMSKNIKTIIRLTKQFFYEFTEEKRRRNVVDFNDLEQLSIKILLEKDEEGYRPSQAADELRDSFEEIMIDEYQDSNMVQEAILTSICKKSEDFSNMFMVGDVKQSIYRFRNACPDLFIQKMNSYSQEETFDGKKYPGQRIDLHKNFRSSATILEGCNEVFRKIMHADIGGIEYDKDAEFVPGLYLKPCPDNLMSDKIESYMIKNGKIRDEADFISILIKKITCDQPYYISDGEGYRPVKYGDIVILARSTKGIGQVIFDALTEQNIPCVMERSQGFYKTREIQIMTQMLEVVDNPRVDIPLVGVLLSPMFDFSEDELALVRSKNRGIDFYDSLSAYMEEDDLGNKIKKFLIFLNQMREEAKIEGVSRLIEKIYNQTGIYEKIAMFPDGPQRLANMDSLLEQAKEYEKTSFYGVHSFVNYIRNIKERDQEIGEVNIASEEDDAVRIMTMHKSKGLEFPVCFLAGLGKPLSNPQRDFLSIWQDVGIASKIIYNESSTKKENIYLDLINKRNAMEDLSEELRILYVSMTRAKEKLFLVGSVKNDTFDVSAGYVERLKMKTFFDMLIPTIIPCEKYFENHIVYIEDIDVMKLKGEVEDSLKEEKLYNFDTNKIYNTKVRSLLETTFYDDIVQSENLPVKVSVSEIKHKFMEEDEDLNIFKEDEIKPVPDFMKPEGQEEKIQTGTNYGTLLHRVMANIDFSKTASISEIKNSLQNLVSVGKLKEEEIGFINPNKIKKFFESEIGKIFIEADKKGNLYREKAFMIEKSAWEIMKKGSSLEDKKVLVQGIIDAYAIMEDGIYLLDYKTDKIKKGEKNILLDRYKIQLDIYKEALEKTLGEKVKKAVLYSFSLNEEIE